MRYVIKNKIFLLYIIFLYPLIFDFRTTQGSTKILVYMISVSFLIGSILIISNYKTINKKAFYFTLPFIIFLLFGITRSLIESHSISLIFSSALPMVFFILSVVIASSINIQDEKNVLNFIYIIVIFLISAAIFKFIFSFYYYGVDLSTVRYQIISAGLPLLFSYGLTSFLFQKQHFGIVALFIPIIVVLVSITRTYILVYLAIFFYSIFTISLKKTFRKYLFLLIILLIVLVILYFFIPEVYNRWIVRLFTGIEDKGGIDVTFITRIAESKYQIDTLFSSLQNILFGLGIAAKTAFSSEYRDLLNLVYKDYTEFHSIGYGHNVYVGILFISGLPIGLYMIYKLIVEPLKIRKEFLKKRKKTLANFIILWGGSASFGYLIYGFFGGTFGDRFGAVAYGLSFGIAFLGIRMKKNEKR